MKFTVPPSRIADVLSFELDYLPNPLVSERPILSCQLFNGDRLVGVDAACGGWQSATASVKYPGLPLIDFSTIAAGTSNGRIDFIVSGGSIVFDSQGSVSLGHTILTNSGPTVTYVASGTTAPFELVSPSCR